MGESLSTLRLNAYTGASGDPMVGGALGAGAETWALTARSPSRTFLAPTPKPELSDWRHPEVGWGVVMSEAAGDPPPALQRLLDARSGSRVFRYRPGWTHAFTLLRDTVGKRDVDITGSDRGTLPHFLLIFGGPAEVPWSMQYILSNNRAVGRLALEGEALDNYINALLTDFGDTSADPYRSVVWAVDHGTTDITHLMRNQIAAKVHEQYRSDTEMTANAVFLDGTTSPESARGVALIDTLRTTRPGMIVSTSHGHTGPLDDPGTMLRKLGLPVDQDHQVVEPVALLDAWQPDGAVWYAHACCSAGSDSPTFFDGLFDRGSQTDNVLQGVAKLGPHVAPLPQRLLGAKKPLRAFIGHVEPTFDWTLRQPANRQPISAAITEALHQHLYLRDPVGMAFRDWYARVGGLYSQHAAAARAYDNGEENVADLLYFQLAARDIQSTVILGDPTVALPLRTV
ncbi:MAG TPA: hypothetical protein VE869_01215 [Gemmatimonas sp.]|nr:hypothetical protein [Gemmatimonas sp.]